ncbi:Leucine-rich repeat serine/threonine-protein kinase 2 [Podila epigama]|nr:Leucine-rich repeat serine/threonine-protein kinase 2 [Podila epigama]
MTTNRSGASTTASQDLTDDVMDIEACIDNPVLAPLGRHVNRRRATKQVDKDHIHIDVVRPTSSSAFIQEQEKESHTPVTSLILRRRRLDCEQLTDYLQNLQPALDPQTMSILRSPLLHLTELDLSRNRLTSLPKGLTSLMPFLIYLNLSHNQFRKVPIELCQLTQLQVLIMSQNHIEGQFPHEICSNLTQLKTLRLCANQITSLPPTLDHLDKLESLSMGSVYGGNLLTSFPPHCIQHMTALRELDLSHNKLVFLPADIGHPNSHLRQLVASDNKLEAIPNLNLGRNQLTSLPTEIADLKQLDTLDLSENLLCVIPGDVADFLTKTTLLLTGNPFTRGYCDAGRTPVSEIGGLGINPPTDEERYAAVLKNLSRRAILNSAASSSSSSGHTVTLGSLSTGGGRESSPRLGSSSSSMGSENGGGQEGSVGATGGPSGSENGYEMDQDERLDYHLYYTRHTLSSRPPSRAESFSRLYDSNNSSSSNINNINNIHNTTHHNMTDLGGSSSWADFLGTGASTPRVNAEAVISDIDSYFDFRPTITPTMSTSTTAINAANSSTLALAEPPLLADPSRSIPGSPSLSLATNNLPSNPWSRLHLGQEHSTVTSPSSVPNPPLSSVPATPGTPSTSVSAAATLGPHFFPSLRELAARSVLYHGAPLPLDYIPEQTIDYLQPGARPCAYCRMPYVKEWVSSVRVKSYLGHPAVARRVRFCSASCWKEASDQLEAEESCAAAANHQPAPVVTMGCDLVGGVQGLNLGGTGTSSSAHGGNGYNNRNVNQRLSLSGASISSKQGLDAVDASLMDWSKSKNSSGNSDQQLSPIISSSSSSMTNPVGVNATSQGMRVCKGGQSYWPIIWRERRVFKKNITSPKPSVGKTSVCSGSCLGGGVCEW